MFSYVKYRYFYSGMPIYLKILLNHLKLKMHQLVFLPKKIVSIDFLGGEGGLLGKSKEISKKTS